MISIRILLFRKLEILKIIHWECLHQVLERELLFLSHQHLITTLNQCDCGDSLDSGPVWFPSCCIAPVLIIDFVVPFKYCLTIFWAGISSLRAFNLDGRYLFVFSFANVQSTLWKLCGWFLKVYFSPACTDKWLYIAVKVSTLKPNCLDLYPDSATYKQYYLAKILNVSVSVSSSIKW